jgi:hypothetical protein
MRTPPAFDRSASPDADKSGVSALALTVETAIHALLNTLTPEDCQTVLARLQAQRPANPTPRAGEVLGAVVHVLEHERARRSQWSVSDIKEAVKSAGIDASDKQFYNAIGYLARKGRIEQIGYGQYRLIDYGVIIETLDELI